MPRGPAGNSSRAGGLTSSRARKPAARPSQKWATKWSWGAVPFWAVAKRRSQEPNAEQGGYHDWKAMGDLSLSRAINEAAFALPVQQMSGIIEDFEGLHIIRVIERTEAHLIPFTEAQVEIKEKLQQKRNAAGLPPPLSSACVPEHRSVLSTTAKT